MHLHHKLLICLLFSSSAIFAQRTAFSLGDVKLLESPFLEAQKTDIDYVMALEPDRLLAPFFREAGLTPKAPSYENWENTGLDGHTAGHYLTALAQIVEVTNDAKVAQRLDYMLDELAKCQAANGDGYIGAIPGSHKLWSEVAKGNLKVNNFGVNDTWVPWYNLHKTFAGLRDVYLLTGNEKAKQMLVSLSQWCYNVTSKLTDDQMQEMLRAEHGGMNEVLADVAAISGDDKYLQLAKRFSHHLILDPLTHQHDQLNGMHANTQIPKVIGFERIGELTHDSVWENAADFFWQTVTSHRSIAIGGNSVSEHFNPANNFSSMIETKEGPETCNTYNMLKLSKMLWLRTGDAKYLDFYERGLFNHILSSQHPDGGFVYFTPIRPRHYRVYSQPQQAFWCCVGSGMENHTKYGELIYAHESNDLYINLFIPSVLTWSEMGLELTQNGDLSKNESPVFSMKLKKAKQFAVKFRCPAWVNANQVLIIINNKPVVASINEAHYLVVNRKWKNNDKIELKLPMHLNAEFLPDGSKWAAFTYGPWVLGAKADTTQLVGLMADGSRMGHVANGSALPIDQAPVFIVNHLQPDSLLSAKDASSLQFAINGNVAPSSFDNLMLQPFYQIHDARYMLYWNVSTPEAYAQMQQELQAIEAAKMALDARTIDRVTPGEQQPESDHNFKYLNSESGIHMDRHWRHAAGWFSYDLKNPNKLDAVLQITYSGGDANRRFGIYLNDKLLQMVDLVAKGGVFYDVEYAIPADVIKNAPNGLLTVKFEAAPGSIAGGIYGVKLLKVEVDK